MLSRLSIGCVVQFKKILNDFQNKKQVDIEHFEQEYTIMIVDVKKKYDVLCIDVYDGFDYGMHYELLVLNNSDDLVADNLMNIKKLSIARIQNGNEYKLIVMDYDIIKSRKRKRKVDPFENKKQKLDSNNYYYNLRDIVDIQLNQESKKKKTVNVIGIVESMSEIRIIKTRKYQSETELLNFNLIDEHGYHVKCALWGMNALFLKHSGNLEKGNIVYIKNAQLSPFDGITLSCTFGSRVLPMSNNSNTKCIQLDTFFRNEFSKLDRDKSISRIYFELSRTKNE